MHVFQFGYELLDWGSCAYCEGMGYTELHGGHDGMLCPDTTNVTCMTHAQGDLLQRRFLDEGLGVTYQVTDRAPTVSTVGSLEAIRRRSGRGLELAQLPSPTRGRGACFGGSISPGGLSPFGRRGRCAHCLCSRCAAASRSSRGATRCRSTARAGCASRTRPRTTRSCGCSASTTRRCAASSLPILPHGPS